MSAGSVAGVAPGPPPSGGPIAITHPTGSLRAESSPFPFSVMTTTLVVTQHSPRLAPLFQTLQLTDLQTTPARISNDLCAPDSQFFYCGVNGISKQRMCHGFSEYCSNGEDEFVQLCGIDECREKNIGIQRSFSFIQINLFRDVAR
ncbi:hypothetical protein E2C01_043808 [Portunus trituberculatus]|uniref:Uncharacterized protein n=1 Tax=Portunus trituberculatus TaxID=210409 RepID=A0A5B7FXQ2_PORTR|nr:hypothetical protein [Portunus trituberculatus]